MPWTKWAFLAGALALVGVPPFAGFFSKDPIIAADAARRLVRRRLLGRAALVGTFLTGLYTFRLYFIVFPGEPSAFVREHHHDHHGREGPWTMLVPVGDPRRCSRSSAAGSSSRRSGTRSRNWLEPVAPTLARRRADELAGVAHVGRSPSSLGLAGIAVAWAIYGERPARRAAAPGACSACSSTSSTSTRRTTRSSTRPPSRSRPSLRREFEEPVVLPTGPDLGDTTLDTGRLVRRIQTGLLRTYVLFLGTGMAVRRPSSS